MVKLTLRQESPQTSMPSQVMKTRRMISKTLRNLKLITSSVIILKNKPGSFSRLVTTDFWVLNLKTSKTYYQMCSPTPLCLRLPSTLIAFRLIILYQLHTNQYPLSQFHCQTNLETRQTNPGSQTHCQTNLETRQTQCQTNPGSQQTQATYQLHNKPNMKSMKPTQNLSPLMNSESCCSIRPLSEPAKSLLDLPQILSSK